MENLSLKCQCGQIRGIAHQISPQTGTRVVCYCDDCQAFANYLEAGQQTLDACGGTDIFQLTPTQIQITQGANYLRCLRFSPKGLIRWYAGCCQTPIGNTVSGEIPFVGLVHSFMEIGSDRDQVLGPVRFSLYGKFATGTPPQNVHPTIPLGLLVRNIPRMLLAKLRGQNQPSPFFNPAGEPISTPTLVSIDQIER